MCYHNPTNLNFVLPYLHLYLSLCYPTSYILLKSNLTTLTNLYRIYNLLVGLHYFLFQAICKCKLSCKDISHVMKMKLYQEFRLLDGNAQGNYLFGLIDLVPVGRRRYKTYDEAAQSRRQSTVCYTIPDGKGGFTKVCKKTFMDIFGIKSSKKIEVVVKKKKAGDTIFKDKRGGLKTYKYTFHDRKIVREHINSFPRDESHYGRKKSNKEYLSSDLSLPMLYKAFLAKFPDSQIKIEFYRKVFRKDFNLSFRRPRADTCKTCDLLNIQSKSPDAVEANKAKKLLEIHHVKSELAFDAMKRDAVDSALPSSTKVNVVMDLQKVFPLPKLTHSNMYYSRQLSCFNFGIHVSNSGDSVMCLWHEGQSGRGGNQMASCLLEAINSSTIDTTKRNLTVWSDNCGGQLKNRMLVMLYMMLINWGIFDTIQHNYLLTGHSFSSADRDFAVIEKRAKLCKMQVVDDVKEVILSARTAKPFKVLDMEGRFFNFDEASSKYLNTKPLKISTITSMKFTNNDQGTVYYKDNYGSLEVWNKVSVLKPGIKKEEISTFCLQRLDDGIELPQCKKDDLSKMIPYLDEKNKDFFRKIIG